MAEALGVASSIAGLIQLADGIVRLGYRYIRDFKDAEKSVQNLVDEVNNLAGVLHSLKNVAYELEVQDPSLHSSSKTQHIYSCQTTLERIQSELENAIPEVKTISQKLKWPFKKGTLAELLSEIQNHKRTMIMALNTRQMSALVGVLANQSQVINGIAAINTHLEASQVQQRRRAADVNLRKKLELLGTIDVKQWQNSNVRLRHPNTGLWFIESKEFNDWKSADNSKLWIYGIPGAGKTVLMASVIQELERHQASSQGLAIFYCDYKDPRTHDPRTILGALARQLILQNEHASTQLATFCEKHHMMEHSQGSATTEDICEFIVELSKNFTSVSLVVDGLDEVAEGRAGVARLLRSLNRSSGTIRTLFASRNEIDIQNVLVDYPSISIAAQSGDLRLYVYYEIQKRTDTRELCIQDPKLKDHIIKVLTEGADGMFRWVACQMDYLCECTTDRDRREALKKLPPDLPKSYERILERVNRSSKENQRLVKHTLLWVVYAIGQLTTTQLLQALAVRRGDKTFERENMTTLDELLHWCSSLVRKRSQSNELELAHFTVKEYLLSLSENCDPGLSQYRLSGDHTELAKTCFNFLNLSEFDGTPLPVTSIDFELSGFHKIWPVFKHKRSIMVYVLERWVEHVHRSSWDEIEDELLLLLDESRGSYRLWTFVQYYSQTSALLGQGTFENSLMSCMNRIAGPPRPSPLHWAAMFSLGNVCKVLISRGAKVNAPSVVGTPLYCAIMGCKSAFVDHFYGTELEWEYRLIGIKRLLEAGADLNNIEDLDGLTHSIIEIIYQKWTLQPKHESREFLNSVFNMNPRMTMDAFFQFIEYAAFRANNESRIFDNTAISELLKWGVRTKFKHFATDTLPTIFTLVLWDLDDRVEPSPNLKCLLQLDFHGIKGGSDQTPPDCVLQEHSGNWALELKICVLKWIRISKKCAPYSLESMLIRLAFSELGFSPYNFILSIVKRLLRYDDKLNINWRCTDEAGDKFIDKTLELDDFWIDDDIRIKLHQVLDSGRIPSVFADFPNIFLEYMIYIYVKDEDPDWQLLPNFLARHCNTEYMRNMFHLWLKDKGHENDFPVTDKERNSSGSAIVERFEDDALRHEGKDSGDRSPAAADKKTSINLHLLPGSHDPRDFGKLRILLAHNPDLEIRNGQNLTPLAISIRTKNLKAMYALLIAGADIESRFSHGQTYLHLACYLGNEAAILALLKAGADTTHRDDRGYTAEGIAMLYDRSDIVDLFYEQSDDNSGAESSDEDDSCVEFSDKELHIDEPSGSKTPGPNKESLDEESPCRRPQSIKIDVEITDAQTNVSNSVQPSPSPKFQDLALRPK